MNKRTASEINDLLDTVKCKALKLERGICED